MQERVSILVPGSSGIPEWATHRTMGSEIRIELPLNWYEDINFFGLVLFSHHVPFDDEDKWNKNFCLKCELMVDDQSERLKDIWLDRSHDTYWGSLSDDKMRYDSCITRDSTIWVVYIPKVVIPRSRRWKYFNAHFHITPLRSYYFSLCEDALFEDAFFKAGSFGVHLIYAQDDQNNWRQPSEESSDNSKHQQGKKRLFSLQGIMDFFNPSKVRLFFFFCN